MSETGSYETAYGQDETDRPVPGGKHKKWGGSQPAPVTVAPATATSPAVQAPAPDISGRIIENPALREDARRQAVINKANADREGASVKAPETKSRADHAAFLKTGADRYEEIHNRDEAATELEEASKPNVVDHFPGYYGSPSAPPAGTVVHTSYH